jgi:hypothetical protein
MTLSTLITLNAVLGAAIAYGLLHLLAHGIGSDRRGREGSLGTVPTFTIDQSTGEAPSFSPATSPRVRRRPSP